MLRTALLSLVSAAKLSGPSSHFSRIFPGVSFDELFVTARRNIQTTIYHYLSYPVHSAKQVLSIPAWVRPVYRATALSMAVALKVSWRTHVQRASSYILQGRAGSSPDGGPGLDRFDLGSYSITNLKKHDLVEPLSVQRASLPPLPHMPVDMMSLLPWPFDEIFSESGFRRLVDDSRRAFLGEVPAFDFFESEAERGFFLVALGERRMVRFLPGWHPHANGTFGLKKSALKQRFLADLRRGNFCLISMKQLKQVFEEYLAKYPDRASGVDAKFFELFKPSALAHMPGGAICKTVSDLSDFFHFIAVPPWIQEHQKLTPVRAVDVGCDPRRGPWVTPVLTTLGMGFAYATLIAQLVHDALLRPSLVRSVRLRTDSLLSPDRKRALVPLRSSSGADGMVLLSDVPHALLDDALSPWVKSASSLLPNISGLRIPVAALAFEIADDADSGPDCVRLAGYDLRDPDTELRMVSHGSEVDNLCAFAFMLYIDDHHAFFYGSPSPLVHALADLRLLASACLYVEGGFSVHAKKLTFASNVPSKTLGYLVDLRSPCTTIHVPVPTLMALQRETRDLIASVREAKSEGKPCLVSQKLIQHLVSSWIWAIMVRRCLLSIFSAIFSVTKCVRRDGLVAMSEAHCAELETAVALAPMMFARLAPRCTTVVAFDASSIGYGVAYRRDCPADVLRELMTKVECHGAWTAFSTNDCGDVAPSRLADRAAGHGAFAASRWFNSPWSPPSSWKVARSGRWISRPRHITIGEALAGYMALRWLAATRRGRGRTSIIFGDNRPCIGAFAKGRSSVVDLNHVCRKACALQVSCDLFAFWAWLRSEANPADMPSRVFRQ